MITNTDTIKKINRFLGSLKKYRDKYLQMELFAKLNIIWDKLNVFLNKNFRKDTVKIPSGPNTSKFFAISKGYSRFVKSQLPKETSSFGLASES